MLDCRACVLRCLRAIVADAPLATVSKPLLLTANRTQRRRLTTLPATALKTEADGNAAQVDKQKTNAVVTDRKVLRTELDWLKDPVKLADHVHYTLRNDNPQKALDLCRLASQEMNAVVSWNHCIDWHVKKGKYNAAITIYNEMKKRAQFPDSYTYLLLLRCSSETLPTRGASIQQEKVVKALNIYNSMSSPSSRVKPSIIHTNAVLRVCSLARDMDAVWSVAGKLPEKGADAADHITYSILLGAIRFGAFGQGDGDDAMENVSVKQIAQMRQQAVNEGRRVWQEIVAKWRSGEVKIDESLVVEMANLLLISKRIEDWDDVLNLVCQTTGLGRLIAPIGSPERQTGHVPADEETELQTTIVEDVDGWVQTPASDAFKAITAHKHDPLHPKRPTSLAFVKPGNGILNVLLTACNTMRTPKAAHAYWDKLTSEEYGVVPDRSNLLQILRILRLNRASKRSVEIVQKMHNEFGIEARELTYRVAMSTCTRDWKNRNAIDHATALIDDMAKHLSYPDVQTLDNYLSLAVQTNDGSKIVEVLDRLEPLVHICRSRVTYGAEGLHRAEHIRVNQDTSKFFRTMIGVMDALMNRGLVPRADFQYWHHRRSQLNTFVTRAMSNTAVWQQRMDERRGRLGGETPAENAIEQRRRLRTIVGSKPRTSGPKGHGKNVALAEFRKKGRDWTEKNTQSEEKLQTEKPYNGRRTVVNGVIDERDRLLGGNPQAWFVPEIKQKILERNHASLRKWKFKHAKSNGFADPPADDLSKNAETKGFANPPANSDRNVGMRRGFADLPGDLGET